MRALLVVFGVLTASYMPAGPQSFSVHCSKAIKLEDRQAYYESFFRAMSIWEHCAPSKAKFRITTDDDSANYDVEIGPEPVDPLGDSCVVGEIWYSGRGHQGCIRITSEYGAKAVQSIAAHELGHALGLPDSYDHSDRNPGKWKAGYGVMRDFDIEHLNFIPDPREVEAVLRCK